MGKLNLSGDIALFFSWGLAVAVLLVVSAFFGIAISKLSDAGVIGMGVALLTCGVLVVIIQGSYLSGKYDERDALSLADPKDLMGRKLGQSDNDRFNVRSYSLLVRADLMKRLSFAIDVDDLMTSGVHMTESGLLQCGNSFVKGEVSFKADTAFLVIVKGSVGDRLFQDVTQTKISSVMFGGGVFRIVALTEDDFPQKDNDLIKSVIDGNDVYMISTGNVPKPKLVNRTVEGGVERDNNNEHDNDTPSCSVPAVYMPWSQHNVQVNIKAVDAVSMLTMGTSYGMTNRIQVWGLGGR